MGSDFDLRDLLKPHLSPALPHWKRTRVLAGQNNSKNADLQASLITSTNPHWKRIRLLAGQNLLWTRDLEASLIWGSPRRWVSQHRIGQDYWQVHKWKGQNATQSLGEVATQRLNRQPQGRWPPGLLTNKLSPTREGGWEFSLLWTKLTE